MHLKTFKISLCNITAFILLFGLFSAQIAYIYHISEYGPLDHKHENKHCKIFTINKENGNGLIPSTTVSIDFTGYKITYFMPTKKQITLHVNHNYYVRAPPKIFS